MKEKCTSGCLDGADLFVRDAESTRATDLRTDSAHLLRVDVRRRRLLAMLRKDIIIIRDHRARLVSALGAHRVLGKYLPALESWILGIAPCTHRGVVCRFVSLRASACLSLLPNPPAYHQPLLVAAPAWPCASSVFVAVATWPRIPSRRKPARL